MRVDVFLDVKLNDEQTNFCPKTIECGAVAPSRLKLSQREAAVPDLISTGARAKRDH